MNQFEGETKIPPATYNSQTYTASSICPRCGQAVSTWHPKPQCDAFYSHTWQASHNFITGAEPDKPKERRLFVVHQKGKGGMYIDAEECIVSYGGSLVFRTGGHLVMAFSPEGWSFVEEGDPEDKY